MARRQIIAMGGGGFSMETTPLLDDFILSRARRNRPRVCFVPTASGDSPTYIVKFYRAFSGRDCIPTYLTLYENPTMPRQPAATRDLPDFIGEQDVIYVGGGNTANALALWRVHGIDKCLRTAWESGTVLCGVSAGMICWFSASVTDSYGPFARLDDGLGLLPYSACPHYDGEAERRPRYHALIAEGMPAGYAAEDSAALCFDGDTLAEVVTSQPDAGAYHVSLRDGAVHEEELPARYLG
ncbi:MAG TPA: peptidase E [Kofleriaceae bacterium]